MVLDHIDMDDLLMALEDNNPEHSFFLDTASGEVLMIYEDWEDAHELFAEVDENPERYLPIEAISSSEGFEIMEDYVETLGSTEAASRLAKALSGRHPFRTFKDVLSNYPEIRQKWFEFHDERLLRVAAQWLEENDIKLKPKKG
jgi:hypothetical protein